MLVAAVIPAVFGVYYAFALPGHTTANAAPQTSSQPSKAASQHLPDFTRIVEENGPAVVNVSVSRSTRAAVQGPGPGNPQDDPLQEFLRRFGQQGPQGQGPQAEPEIQRGLGSGFIISADGIILTNAHVVAEATEITVKLTDRREFDARVVGADPTTDVAVIKIDATGLVPMPFGNSDQARVGEMVLAIGNPLGDNLTFSVTSGIVSAKGRRLQGLERQDGRSIGDFIQTDAVINPGNSGGPLVNIQGEVIGINSAIASETGLFSGYGFAIPINLARTVMDQLIATGHVSRAALGVLVQDADADDAEFVGLRSVQGVVVQDFSGDDSPAKAAGIQRGDVIITIDGQPVNYVGQLQQVVGFKPVGQSVHVEVARQGGVHRTFDVRLISGEARTRGQIARADDSSSDGNGKDASGNPTAPANTLLGVSVTPLTAALSERLELQNHVEGVVITEVDPSGPAADKLFDEAGGSGPDIIVAVNGHAVRSESELRDALRSVGAGKIASLDIYNARSDSRRMERVRLGQ